MPKFKIIDQTFKYFHKGEQLEPGMEIYGKPSDDLKEVVLKPYTVAMVKDHLFYIGSPEKELEEFSEVTTSKGKGVLISKGEDLGVVSLVDGGRKPFYLKDLIPIQNNFDMFMKAVENYEAFEKDIEQTIRNSYVRFTKALFGEEESSAPTPKKFTDTFKDALSKPQDAVRDFAASKNTKPESYEFGFKNMEKLNLPKPGAFPEDKSLQSKNSSNPFSIKERPTKNYVLSHVRLNPESKSSADKYHLSYKVGGKFVTTHKHLDPAGNEISQHPALQGKIFVPGEKVEHKGSLYNVKSHINPMPQEGGHPDYSNMLVTDKLGVTKSIPRAEANLVGHDKSRSHKVTMSGGGEKFHHELKTGDKFMHNGTEYTVDHANDKGYMSRPSEGGNWYWQHAENFDKPFKHNIINRHQKAEKGDEIEFSHMGSKKVREVLDVNDQGAVVKVNKTEEPLLIKHGDYYHTGNKAHEKYRPVNPNVVETSDINKPEMNTEEFKKFLADSDEIHSAKGQQHQAHIERLNQLVGTDSKPHRVEQNGDYETIHKLGIGDIGIKTTLDPEKQDFKTEVVNPDIKIKNKSYKVKGINPENNNLILEDRESLKGKPFEISLDKLKDTISVTDKPEEMKETTASHKEKLLSNLGQEYLKDPENWKDNAKDHIKEYEAGVNKIKRGNAQLEPDDYAPDKIDINNMSEHLGDDWEKQVASKGEKLKKEAEDYEKYKQEKEKTDKENAKLKESQQKVVEENKQKEKKPERDYTENTYNKLEDLSSKSLSGKAGLKSGIHHISVKSDKHDNTEAAFHIVEAHDLHTSDNLAKEHEDRHTNEMKKLHKVPFLKNENFPPTGAQLRDYSSPSQEAETARQFTIEKVADKFKPDEVINSAPQGDSNAPVVDKKGVVMGGNGRILATRLLSGDAIEKNKSKLKSRIKEFYPEASDEQIKSLEKQIDSAKNPIVVRMAKHPSGEDYDFGAHTDDYKQFTKVLNESNMKEETQRAKSEGIQAALTTEARDDLYKTIPEKTNLNKFLSIPKNFHKVLDKLEKHGIITPDKRATLADEKGITEEGKGFVNEIFKGGYFSKEMQDALEKKLKPEDRDKVHNFKNAHIGTLLDLKTNKSYYDLKPELENVIKSFSDDKGQLKGQSKIVEDSVTTKGLKYILGLPIEQQKEVLNAYTDSVNTNEQIMAGGSMFPETVDNDSFKNNFFKRYADYYDYAAGKKKPK